jgi:hypothetical protein
VDVARRSILGIGGPAGPVSPPMLAGTTWGSAARLGAPLPGSIPPFLRALAIAQLFLVVVREVRSGRSVLDREVASSTGSGRYQAFQAIRAEENLPIALVTRGMAVAPQVV